MSSSTTAAPGGLPPDLFDTTTILSLLLTVALVIAAYGLSLRCLPRTAPGTIRFLFIWHAADALCHFLREGSYLYHCFFSSMPAADLHAQNAARLLAAPLSSVLPVWPTPPNWLGRGLEDSADFVYGSQAGGDNPFAQLWMVYSKADMRWAGVDLVGGFRAN